MSEDTDKMEIKKVSEQQLANNCADSESKVTEGPVTSRRTFTRNVLVGSAVLLTLSNRSAWAATETVCVSTNLLMSYNNGQPSALNDLQNAEIENFYDYTKYPIDKRKNEREENGDTCFDINGPHVNSDNSDNSGSYFLLDETTSSEL